MLGSRKRTCRRSKSRCGGTGPMAGMGNIVGRGGGSRRGVRRSRRGGYRGSGTTGGLGRAWYEEMIN